MLVEALPVPYRDHFVIKQGPDWLQGADTTPMSEATRGRGLSFKPAEDANVPRFITGTVATIADHIVEVFPHTGWDRMVVCIALDTLGVDALGPDSDETIRTHWAAFMGDIDSVVPAGDDWPDDYLVEQADSLVAHRAKVGAGWNFITLKFRHVTPDRLAVDTEYRRVVDPIALLNDTDFHVFQLLDDAAITSL